MKFICAIINIIITLIQEDNIFGTSASLTYGPRYSSVIVQYTVVILSEYKMTLV